MKKRFAVEVCRGRCYLVDTRRDCSIAGFGIGGEQVAQDVAGHLNSTLIEWSASRLSHGRVCVSGFCDGERTHFIGSFGDSLEYMVKKVELEIIQRVILDFEVPVEINWIASDVRGGVELSSGDGLNFRVIGVDQMRKLGQELLKRAAVLGGAG